jgi:hypothetical protein
MSLKQHKRWFKVSKIGIPGGHCQRPIEKSDEIYSSLTGNDSTFYQLFLWHENKSILWVLFIPRTLIIGLLVKKSFMD